MNDEQNVDFLNMDFTELRQECKSRGLSAGGTKEELQERLMGSAPLVQPQMQEEAVVEEAAAPQAPVSPPVVEKPQAPKLSEAQESRNAERALRADAKKMKEHLEKQPKVSIMIPPDPGLKPEDVEKNPFVVNLNGYKMEFPVGQYIQVPQQVFEIISERLESEGKIGKQWRIDSDSNRMKSLQG